MIAARSPVVAGAVAACLAATLVVSARVVDALAPVETLERWTLDLRFRLRGPVPPGDDVAIVAFDDATDAADPTLFERRAGWARLLDAIARARPRAVGVDAFFVDEEALLPDDLARDVEDFVRADAGARDDEAAALLRRVGDELSGDEALEAAIARAGHVVLAVHLGMDEGEPSRGGDLSSATYGQAAPGPRMPGDARAVVASLPRFARRAAAQGMVTVRADDDQAVRELIMARRHDGAVVAPLSVHLAAAALGVDRARTGYVADPPTLHLGDRRVPVGERHTMVLNFRGPAGTIPTLSASDVLAGRADDDLAGRVVLVGFTHLGHDATRTPFGPLFPGVEVHATAVDNLLDGDPIRRAPLRLDLALSLLVGLLVASCFASRLPLRPAARIAAAALVVAAALVASQAAFASGQRWISVLGPLASGGLAMLAAVSSSWLVEGRERRRVRRAFAHYLSDDVIEQVLREPGLLALGGARRNTTILFSDVRGFTTLAERTEPLELVRFLNAYLTPMTRAVLEQGGYLDKYVGDAIMAVFGAPLPVEDHAERGVRAALAMHARLQELKRAHPGDPLVQGLRIGVGLNTGDVVVGNMGSAERFDYTAIGDAVNLASRVEGLTKLFGAYCLVGDETRRRAGPAYSFRQVASVRVKGRSAPEPVHELLSGPGVVVAALEDVEAFAEGLRRFSAGDLRGARERFAAFARANPHDPVVALYLARLDALGEEAPAGFDGVLVAEEK